MAVTVGCDPSLMRHSSASMHSELKELGDRWGLQTVLAVVGLVDQTLVRIRHSVYARVLLEATVIQICNLPDLQNIANLAAAADSLGGSVSAAKSPAATPGNGSEKKNVVSDAAQTAHSKNSVQQASDSPQPSAQQSSATELSSRELSSRGNGSSLLSTPTASRTENLSSQKPAQANSAAGELPNAESPTVATADPEQPDRQPPEVQTLSAASATSLWEQAAEQVEPTTAALALSVQRVELSNENTLRLVFAAESKLSVRRFDSAEHKTPMMAALKQLVGQDVKVECTMAAPASKDIKKASKPSSKDRMLRLREIEGHPLVQACVEVFGAEVVKVDHRN